MPSSHKGHFVQIWRPVGDPYGRTWVEVEGRAVARSISRGRWDFSDDGWCGVSRELPLRRAKYFAKAYARAGFPSRVVFRGHGVRKIVLEVSPKR